MNKKFILILVVQFVFMTMFLVYALVQRTQAIKSQELAKQTEQRALAQAQLAQVNEAMAMRTRQLAEQQAAAAQAALEACSKRK